MIRYNSFSYNNDKKPLLNNLKKSISKNNEEYNIHKILRSSSFAFPSSFNSDNFFKWRILVCLTGKNLLFPFSFVKFIPGH